MHWCSQYCTVSLLDDTKICNLSNIWRTYTCLQILTTSFYKNKPTLKNDPKNYLFFEEEEEPVAHGVEAHEYS